MVNSSWFFGAHADARARVRAQSRLMWQSLFGCLFWFSMMFVLRNGWSTLAMVLFIAIGLKWCQHFYEYRCARIEALYGALFLAPPRA